MNNLGVKFGLSMMILGIQIQLLRPLCFFFGMKVSIIPIIFVSLILLYQFIGTITIYIIWRKNDD